MGHPWLTRALVRDVLAEDAPDDRVLVLATAQGGPVSWAQAWSLGVTKKALRGRRDSSRWPDLHHGVVVVGHQDLSLRGTAIGALLSMPDCVLSNALAAAVYCPALPQPHRPHVTTERVTRRKTILVHNAALPSADVRRHLGLPITTPARTALDCAETEPRAQAARIVRELRVKGLVSDALLRDQIARSPGRRGIKPLRAILAGPDGAPTRSWGEQRLLELVVAAGLPVPDPNHGIAGRERDQVWSAQRLIVEVDDWSTHGDRESFERDRARDAELVAAGWRVLRVTTTQIRDEPLKVIATLAAALRGRRTAYSAHGQHRR